MRLFTNERTGFDRAGFEDMLIQYGGIKLMDFALDFLGISSMKEGGLAEEDMMMVVKFVFLQTIRQ